MGETYRIHRIPRGMLVAVMVVLGLLLVTTFGGEARAAAKVPTSKTATVDRSPGGDSFRAVRKCRMGGGYVLINLRRMKCQRALRLTSAWWKRFSKKPRRVYRVQRFRCRWTGRLRAEAIGRLTCARKVRRKVIAFSVRRP